MSLQKAYDNFFAGRANYPGYKKKGKSHESFYLSNDKFTVGSHWMSIPGLGRFLLDQRKIEKGRGKLLRKHGTVISPKSCALLRREKRHSRRRSATSASRSSVSR